MLGALYSTPEAIATLVSLSGFMMQVFWSLVGGAIYLAYRSTEHTSLAEMEKSVDALEKRVEHNIEAGRPSHRLPRPAPHRRPRRRQRPPRAPASSTSCRR
jgi:hypothetical protein